MIIKVLKYLIPILFTIGTIVESPSGQLTSLGSIYGVHYFVYGVPFFGVLAFLFPQFFRMGVQGFRKAFIIKKLLPFVYVAALIAFISLIPQTYVTALLVSYLLGMCIGYIKRIIGSYEKEKPKKGVKKRGR